MATTRRVRGVRPRAILAAGLLAAAAIASIPARAATTPVLEATNVDNGWNHGRHLIAEFDQDIRGGQTVTVTKADGTAVVDGKGNPITGTVTTSFSQSFLTHDLVVWTPDLSGKVDSRNVPLRALPEGSYKMTIAATSDTTPPLTSTTETKTFQVDNLGPSVLRITSPANRSLQTGAIELSGVTSDNPGSKANKSGIASVRLFFYNASDPFTYEEVQTPTGDPVISSITTYQPGEVVSERRFAKLAACDLNTPACVGQDISGNDIVVQETSFTADLSDLGPGLWTVKAIATDKAGNQSGEVSVTFLKAA